MNVPLFPPGDDPGPSFFRLLHRVGDFPEVPPGPLSDVPHGTTVVALRYGDGWIPIPGRGAVPLGEGTARLAELAAERGRPPIPVTVFGARPEPDVIAHYAEAGVDRVLFRLPSIPTPEALKLLDTYANIAETDRSSGNRGKRGLTP